MQKSMLVVVESDPTVQRAVVRIGVAEGFEVVVCATPRAALNAATALAPDCVIVAVNAEDHEGFWLLAALRARPDATAALPLIALAARDPGAHASSITRIQALEAGADVVLQKPIETSEVIAQVKALTKLAARARLRRSVSCGADGLGMLAGDLDLEPVSDVLAGLEASGWSGELRLGDRGFASRELVMTISSGALRGGHFGDRALTPVSALREALGWSGRRFTLAPAEAPRAEGGAASLAELVRALLASPGAPPLGVGIDDDLPLVSARASAAPSAQDAASDAVEKASLDPGGPAPGRHLVESVRASVRPDPRAEADS